MTEKYRVRVPYKSSYLDPIAFHIGDCLFIEDRESDWIGWTWCRNQAGKSGWVPTTYIDRQGSRAIALQDYDAVELTVDLDEILEGGIKESGWLWCIKPSGVSGWVPCENIEKLT